jgi:hypothetical protein
MSAILTQIKTDSHVSGSRFENEILSFENYRRRDAFRFAVFLAAFLFLAGALFLAAFLFFAAIVFLFFL